LFKKTPATLKNYNDWDKVETDIFWAEIAPCEHVVQIYENDGVFLDALAGFVMGGINSNDCVIVIATHAHLEALNKRLRSFGTYLDTLVHDDRFIPLEANDVLSKFMVDGWPDEDLFVKTISEIVQRGVCHGRKVRAFGEMVAILWAEGNQGATVNLEHLWNNYCAEEKLSLFCAYPKSGFTQNINESISAICECHSKMIEGTKRSLTQVLFRKTA
jgi:hypothetical protein